MTTSPGQATSTITIEATECVLSESVARESAKASRRAGPATVGAGASGSVVRRGVVHELALLLSVVSGAGRFRLWLATMWHRSAVWDDGVQCARRC